MTLRTDYIELTVTKPEVLEPLYISATLESIWSLKNLEENDAESAEITIDMSPDLASLLSFEELTKTVTFHGNESSNKLAG